MGLNYFASMGLTICGLVFLLLVSFSYLKNREAKTFESKLFITILILGVLSNFVEIFFYVTSASLGFKNIISKVCGRIDIFLSIAFSIFVAGYLIAYLYRKKINESDNYKNSIAVILGGITLFIFILSYNYGVQIEFLFDLSVYSMNEAVLKYIYFSLGIMVLSSIYTLFFSKEKVIKTPIVVILSIALALVLINNITGYRLLFIKFLYSTIIIALSLTTESTSYKLIKTLENTKRTADKTNEAQTEFISSMSHEIRSPLATILGLSKTSIEDENLTSEDIINTAKGINEASNELFDLVSNISDLFELDYRKDLIVNKYFNFSTVIFELNNTLKEILPEDTDLKMIVNENIPSVFNGDQNNITKALKLVLSNVCDTTPYGFVEISYNGNNLAQNEYILKIEIKNSGINTVKPEALITFEEYMTNAKETVGKTNRYSLGIVVAKRYIELMGGRLEFPRFNSEYAECVILIPLEVINPSGIGNILEVNENDVPETPEQSVSIETASASKAGKEEISEESETPSEEPSDSIEYTSYFGKTALIIDDYLLNVRLLKEKLNKYHIECDYSDDTTGAIRKTKNAKYDLIFLDKTLDGEEGLEALEELKKYSKEDNKIVLTLDPDETVEKRKYSRQGIKGYLTKPIDDKELDKLLKKYYYVKEEENDNN